MVKAVLVPELALVLAVVMMLALFPRPVLVV